MSMDFAELHAISNFTFLRGASHPEELVRTASELGYRAIAITDECSVAGVVRAHQEARERDIKLIVGSEFLIGDEEGGEPIHLVVLAPDRSAYGQLSTLITVARRRATKGEYALNTSDLNRVEDCLAIWIPSREPMVVNLRKGQEISSLLPNLWLCLELFSECDDILKTTRILDLSMHLDLPVIASNGAVMHTSARKPLQDVLTAVRLKCPVHNLGRRIDQNRDRHLKPLDALKAIYPREMLAETCELADRCTFRLDELRYEYPKELVPPGLTPAAHLRQLTEAGALARWPSGPPDEVTELVERELKLIADLRYEYFFLTVHDIVRFARENSILCQGRGSAANSAVCYCLGITEVDPARMHLLFERFVSKERNEPPDIDVDFEHERREEVIQYIYRRYGRDRAALAATLITYRPRSAIRDVGKALGFDVDFVDLLAKSMSWWDNRSEIEKRFRAAGIDPNGHLVRQFIFLVNEILGFPRHLSQHVGGFVISAGPLAELVPIENAAMDERTVIQWDKDDLEALGLLKVDVLGLGMLTAIRKALALVAEHHGRPSTMSEIPPEDPETYAMLQKADSVGVFQVESRAQMSMLPRLKPANYYDLVIEVAIVRPGPIQGNMVHPYLRRRKGEEAVTYPSDAVRQVLERTLGIPIFQEQVIELAMVAAGFSAGEADSLRRAMAAWKRHGGLEPFERKLIDGMLERGHDRDFAERVFEQIKGFGEYGFPESHSASFALLVYISAWLKRHEPAAFYCGILNSLPMGFYSPAQLVKDAAAHGIDVRPADVQVSGWDHRLETPLEPVPDYRRPQPALRIGLRRVKGLHEEAGRRVEEAQPYVDIDDLTARAALDDRALTCLARAGALKTLSGHRYQAHWDAAGVDRPLPIQRETAPYHTAVALDGPGMAKEMLADYRYLGLSLGPHPLALLRNEPEFRNCRTARDLEGYVQGNFIQIAGIVTCRQRPSGPSGVVFMTLEDETGNSNVIIWKSILERFRAVLLQSQLIAIKGVVEREGAVIHVIAGHARDLSHKLRELANDGAPEAPKFAARNFH
ncbi:MAG: error-prone DNA polymerase [Gammaproteobacteria bacterium]|nr:error-prone DNA polymerase [Gammaproteobacteria bacterium]